MKKKILKRLEKTQNDWQLLSKAAKNFVDKKFDFSRTAPGSTGESTVRSNCGHSELDFITPSAAGHTAIVDGSLFSLNAPDSSEPSFSGWSCPFSCIYILLLTEADSAEKGKKSGV